MFTIKHKSKIAEAVYLLKVHAPRIARSRKAGQFIMLQADENGERIPLTIADSDQKDGTITLIFQAVGTSTRKLAAMEEGSAVKNLLGPLGMPTHIEKWGRVAAIGGGVGIAPLYPIAKAMADAGNSVTAILGARSKNFMILEAEMKKNVKDIRVVTDDGSYGSKGLVTDELRKMIDSGEKPDMVIAIGPLVMMKAVSDLTRTYNIKTMVSLNPIMVDGTGMCGGCRVNVAGKAKFACVDGPEFNAHEVDYETLASRLRAYRELEQHSCRILEKN